MGLGISQVVNQSTALYNQKTSLFEGFPEASVSPSKSVTITIDPEKFQAQEKNLKQQEWEHFKNRIKLFLKIIGGAIAVFGGIWLTGTHVGKPYLLDKLYKPTLPNRLKNHEQVFEHLWASDKVSRTMDEEIVLLPISDPKSKRQGGPAYRWVVGGGGLRNTIYKESGRLVNAFGVGSERTRYAIAIDEKGEIEYLKDHDISQSRVLGPPIYMSKSGEFRLGTGGFGAFKHWLGRIMFAGTDLGKYPPNFFSYRTLSSSTLNNAVDSHNGVAYYGGMSLLDYILVGSMFRSFADKITRGSQIPIESVTSIAVQA